MRPWPNNCGPTKILWVNTSSSVKAGGHFEGEPERQIVGIVADFHDGGLGKPSYPIMMTVQARQFTIDRLSLEPSENSEKRISIAGDPFTPELIGPQPVTGQDGLANMGKSRALLATEVQHRRPRLVLKQRSS
jgi:hypothetical protein